MSGCLKHDSFNFIHIHARINTGLACLSQTKSNTYKYNFLEQILLFQRHIQILLSSKTTYIHISVSLGNKISPWKKSSKLERLLYCFAEPREQLNKENKNSAENTLMWFLLSFVIIRLPVSVSEEVGCPFPRVTKTKNLYGAVGFVSD